MMTLLLVSAKKSKCTYSCFVSKVCLELGVKMKKIIYSLLMVGFLLGVEIAPAGAVTVAINVSASRTRCFTQVGVPD